MPPLDRSPLARLRIAALPFVTRSLRGGRARRFAVLALVLALIGSTLGSWLALGDGELERGIREDLQLEPHRYEREHREFLVIVDDDASYERARRDRESMLERGSTIVAAGAMADRAMQARHTLRQAVDAIGVEELIDPDDRELHRRAAQLLGEHEPPRMRARNFAWDSGAEVERLRRIVDARGIPALERYASPLGVGWAVRLVGLLAGAALLVLFVVVGPVLTGIAVAQESHDNTLQPVAGTALSSRQIALGLVLGALAPVAIVAVPQLVLAVLAGVLVGDVLELATFFALLVPCAWAATMLALVVGLFAGRRRGTGAIGITLLAGLGTWLCAGIPLGFDRVSRSDAAVMTMLPSGGLVRGLRETFVGSMHVQVDDAGLWWRLLAAAIASLVVGALALRAAERRVPGRFVSPLRRREALVGSIVLSALTLLAVSTFGGPEAAFVSLAAMVMPMQVLLMARVPAGDAPSGRGVVRLPALLGEFGVFVGLHCVLALAIVGPEFLVRLADSGTLHLLWALAVAPLVALRIVAAPPRLPASVFAGFGFVCAIIEFVSGTAQVLGDWRNAPLFPLMRVSPVLGLLHVALLVVVPWALVRGIRRASRSTPASAA